MHLENIYVETFSGLRWVMLLQERPFAGQVGCIFIQIGQLSKLMSLKQQGTNKRIKGTWLN
jgi:hypothetical protein